MSDGTAIAHRHFSLRAVWALALLTLTTTFLLDTVVFQALVSKHAAGCLLDVTKRLVSHALRLAANAMVVAVRAYPRRTTV